MIDVDEYHNIFSAMKYVVPHVEVEGVRSVTEEHQVTASFIRLTVAPTTTRVEADIVLEVDIMCDGGLRPIPIFERILAVPDDVVSVDDVVLLVFRVALIGQASVIDFPDSAVFHEVVMGAVPKLYAISVSHVVLTFLRFSCELVSSADETQIAIPDDDMMRVSTPNSMCRAICKLQTVIDDVMFAALVYDMSLQGALDVVV